MPLSHSRSMQHCLNLLLLLLAIIAVHTVASISIAQVRGVSPLLRSCPASQNLSLVILRRVSTLKHQSIGWVSRLLEALSVFHARVLHLNLSILRLGNNGHILKVFVDIGHHSSPRH